MAVKIFARVNLPENDRRMDRRRECEIIVNVIIRQRTDKRGFTGVEPSYVGKGFERVLAGEEREKEREEPAVWREGRENDVRAETKHRRCGQTGASGRASGEPEKEFCFLLGLRIAIVSIGAQPGRAVASSQGAGAKKREKEEIRRHSCGRSGFLYRACSCIYVTRARARNATCTRVICVMLLQRGRVSAYLVLNEPTDPRM